MSAAPAFQYPPRSPALWAEVVPGYGLATVDELLVQREREQPWSGLDVRTYNLCKQTMSNIDIIGHRCIMA